MMVKAGSTSNRDYRFRAISAAGAPVTTLTSASAGAAAGYRRTGAARVAITLSTLTNVEDAFSSGGMKHEGNGWYILHVPDLAIAAGVDQVGIDIAFTDATIVNAPIRLLGYDPRTELTTAALAFLDAAITSRSTYAGGDTSGVTTLLTAVADLPTNTELATALGTADDAVLAAVATQAANLITLVQSIARSDVAEDSDIGGTFDSATDSLQALRDFISSGDGSVVSTTTTRGDVTLIAGDDYNNTDGRAISWSVTNPGSISLSGATITFVADQAVNTAGVVTDFSDASITVTTATGSTLAFYLELTAVETATLMPGHYRYRVQAALATNARVITLATGVLTVTADYD